MIKSRYGKGSPLGSATGSASAAASETIPRMPHQLMMTSSLSGMWAAALSLVDCAPRAASARESHAAG